MTLNDALHWQLLPILVTLISIVWVSLALWTEKDWVVNAVYVMAFPVALLNAICWMLAAVLK